MMLKKSHFYFISALTFLFIWYMLFRNLSVIEAVCSNCVARPLLRNAIVHNHNTSHNSTVTESTKARQGKGGNHSTDLQFSNVISSIDPHVIPLHPNTGRVQHLSNVVIDQGPDRDTHHVYSGYYDTRPLPNRPSIVLFGYVRRKSAYPLYCNLKYDSNTTVCLKRFVIQTPLIAPNVWPEAYFCKLKPGDKAPSHVMLSSSSSCDEAMWSSPIPVLNRESTVPEGIGVCVMGGLWTTDGDHDMILRLVLEFLAMVKTLGANIVTMYSINLKPSVLEIILRLYPGFVEIVQWENLNNTLHYYGQRVLINDCIYRNMRKVKYLALIDLDEMILPVSTNNWPGMLEMLEKRGNYASYTFSNNFFEEVKETISLSNERCPYLNLPKYFERLKRLPWPVFKRNTKMKMILKPDLVSVTCIHDLCRRTVSGTKTYWVPPSVGIMAHYRVPVPPWYVYGNGVEDKTALRFQEQVMQEMERACPTPFNITHHD